MLGPYSHRVAKARRIPCSVADIKNYRILNQIGSGSNAIVFRAKKINTDDEVALKISKVANHNPFAAEMLAYELLQGIKGVPKFYGFQKYDKFPFIAITLLGPTIRECYLRRGLSVATIAKLGVKLVKCVKRIHGRGIVHGDIKPANIMVGRDNPRKIYMADFGHSHQYRSSRRHFAEAEVNTFHGTPMFASLNAHKMKSLSRRDDIISIAYTLVFILRRKLPWSSFVVKNSHSIRAVELIKLSCPSSEVCDQTPEEFRDFLEHGMGLGYADEPDYDYLISLMNGLFAKHSNSPRVTFEWETMPPLSSDDEYDSNGSNPHGSCSPCNTGDDEEEDEQAQG